MNLPASGPCVEKNPIGPRYAHVAMRSLPRKDHLWTFLDAEGIEPKNNAAEPALRSAVILRKVSFGTQSSGGSRYLEHILSVSETYRLQKRNAYEYLISMMQAKFAGETAPSLLPLIEDHAAAA